MPSQPCCVLLKRFDDPDAVLAQVHAIYCSQVEDRCGAVQTFVAADGDGLRLRACCLYVCVRSDIVALADSRLSHGFVARPGNFETTQTRLDLLGGCCAQRSRLMLTNHGLPVEVGASSRPIPVHLSLARNDRLEGTPSPERRLQMPDSFDLPDRTPPLRARHASSLRTPMSRGAPRRSVAATP